MEDSGDRALVCDIARDVLAEVSPGELMLFASTSEAYFANPARALKNSRPQNEMMGSGILPGELFSPAVLYIISAVSPIMIDIAKESARRFIDVTATELVRAMFKRYSEAEPKASSGLTSEQVEMVRQKAMDICGELRLPADQTSLLVNALTGQLVVAKE